MRPLRSTRSRNISLPRSRLAITRPASRRVASDSASGSSASALARTAATSSRFSKRLGSGIAREPIPRRAAGQHPLRSLTLWLSGLDLEDFVLQRAARSRDFDRLALLPSHDRLAD